MIYGEKISDLIKDLSFIKDAVKRNRPVFREMLSAENYRSLMLGSGIAVIVIALSFQLFALRYHSFAAIPAVAKALLFGLVAGAVVAGSLLKFAVARRSLDRIDRRLRIVAVFRDYYVPFLHVYLPVLFIMAAVVVVLARSGNAGFIVGATALASGLLFNVLGASVRMGEYYVLGYWLLGTGALSLALDPALSGFWCALSFGGGCLGFVVTHDVHKRRDRRDRDRRE